MAVCSFAAVHPVEPAMGISINAATISPSPGGEGRGEDDRLTNMILKLVLTPALILTFSHQEKKQPMMTF